MKFYLEVKSINIERMIWILGLVISMRSLLKFKKKSLHIFGSFFCFSLKYLFFNLRVFLSCTQDTYILSLQ